MSNFTQGAEIQASPQQPSVDLATLVEVLTKSIETNSSSQIESLDSKQRALFSYDQSKQRLRICTSGVLLRLFSLPEFKQSFDLKNGGFIQNFSLPNYGFRSRLGGQLSEGNEKKLPHLVDKLQQIIIQELAKALPENFSLSELLLEDVQEEFKQLAKKFNPYFKDAVSEANLIPLVFQSSAKEKQKEVAKIISAIERIDTANYFEKMLSGIISHLEELEQDEDIIEEVTDSLNAEYERLESQIKRFLNFLDDEALSRVRLNVTFQIMEAIAQKCQTPDQQLLAEYINRIKYFTEIVKNEGLIIDLSKDFGQQAEINFANYINNINFFGILTVWPEWKTQIFEIKTANSDDRIVREISYRFRVNGNNPEIGKPAFSAKLLALKEALENREKTSPYLLNFYLAQLIFLGIVIPTGNYQFSQEELQTKLIEAVRNKAQENPQNFINDLLNNLENRAGAMKKIATTVMAIMRKKGDKIIDQVEQKISQQYICIKKGIVDWDRLKGAEIGVKDLLITGVSKALEKVAWLKAIEITDNPSLVTDLLFSVKVTTELSEQNLVIKEEAKKIQVKRCFSDKLLQIIFVPFNSENNQYKPSPLAVNARDWVLKSAIQIEYETRTLQRSTKKDNDHSKQLHAATITAFSILIYSCLWCLLKEIKQQTQEKFTTSILRLQEQQKNEDTSGEDYVYAATQSLESILAQDYPTRMQGMVLENLKKSNARYIKSGTFNALLSVFPLAIATEKPPFLPKIALISYQARPCDEHLQTDKKNQLILSQSYIATAIEEPFTGYQIQAERMQSDLIYSEEQLRKQRLIYEEIAHLQHQGCQHIILLSHLYQSRRINKTADYNSPLNNREFLEKLSQDFPNLSIYPLLRDVFPATRLHQRDHQQSGFEILRASDHTYFLNSLKEIGLQRQIIPIYTFATLHAIEAEQRPQSGFCVYFLHSDSSVNLDWTERTRQHLINPEQNSPIHPCLLTMLRGLHFIESEKGVFKNQYLPVLDPFGWISPNTVEAAGEVQILHSRRRGKVLLSYPAILTHIAQVLRRNHNLN